MYSISYHILGSSQLQPRLLLQQQLRIMLDRESLNESDIVHWSTDGSSFIVMDQNQFEDVSTFEEHAVRAHRHTPSTSFTFFLTLMSTAHHSVIFR